MSIKFTRKEPPPFVWKSECMNTKVDMVEVVRCKDCKHDCGRGHGLYCQFIVCEKTGALHKENWFCADGKKKERAGEME